MRSLGGLWDQTHRGHSCESPERDPGRLTVQNDDDNIKVISLQASKIYLDIGSTILDGLSFQSYFAATRPEAAPVLNDPGILELKDMTSCCIFWGASRFTSPCVIFHLKTWFQLAGTFPDILVVYRGAVVIPVTQLKTTPYCNLTTPACKQFDFVYFFLAKTFRFWEKMCR